MEKVIRIYRSHQEADAADVKEDLATTPEQRIEALLELVERYYPDAHSQRFARVYRITKLERS